VGQRQWRAAGFFQDDWKVLPNLTLNLGIRYEYDQPWYEVNNKTGNIDLTNGTVIYAGQIPAGAAPGAQLCSNRACYQPTYTQIMPRLGFAWQATNRFVVRGGYGATSFFEGNAGNQRLTSIYPFIQATSVNAIDPAAAIPASGGNPPVQANGGVPRTVEQGFTSTTSAANFSGSQYSAWPQNMKPAYIQEWSLTTEYAVNATTSLQVGYLGEQGQHLIDYGNVNQQPVPDPTFSSAPYATVGTGSALGPVGFGKLLITESRAMMNYNALQAVLRHRASNGLEYTLNYTYSRSLTNSLGNYSLNVSGYSGAFQNYYNSHADYGPAGSDATHNVSGVIVYALPFGRGKEFGSGVNRWVDSFMGGWSLSGAGVAYSGFPETITGPGGSLFNSYGQERANRYRKLHIVHRSAENWFGTDPSAIPCTTPGVDNGVCAYGAATNATFGTASNGSERGPRFTQIDSAVFKNFHLFSEHTIGFRADAFNVFNIASYGNPDTGVTDSTFGNISNQGSPTRSAARALQLSLHYTF
jgi:hypothetical protein